MDNILIILILLAILYLIYLFHTNIVKDKKIPFDLYKGMPIITLQIAQNKFNFLIDSGATSSFIDKSVLEKLPNLNVRNTNDKIMLVNKQTTNNLQYIKRLRAKKEFYRGSKNKYFTISLNNVYVTSLDSINNNVSGILGGDFLKYYNFQIDYKNKFLYNRFI